MRKILGLVFALVVCVLAGCRSTEYVQVPVVKTEYVGKTDTFVKCRDSICTDSVMVFVTDSTKVVERWRTKKIYDVVYKVKTDTICKVDSISVMYPVYKVEEKTDYKGWICFGILLLMVILWAAGSFVKILR